MAGWLWALLLALGFMVAAWALLVFLARRLPPGLLRDLASFVPDCVTTVLGPLDDVLVVVLARRYAARQVPREVLAAAWPGEPRLLERLLGGGATATGR